MDTNKIELSMDDMELVNGGLDWDLKKTIGGSILGGGVGLVAGACVAVALSGPVGWCLAGGTLAGAAVVGAVRGSGLLD